MTLPKTYSIALAILLIVGSFGLTRALADPGGPPAPQPDSGTTPPP